MKLCSTWARWARPLLITALALPVLAQAQANLLVSPGYASVTEGTGSSRFLEVVLQLSGPATTPTFTGRAFTVNTGSATGGSACTAGVDYVHIDETFTVPRGSSTGDVVIRVEVCGDSLAESAETLALGLEFQQGSVGWCIAPDGCVTTLRIHDDDSTAPAPTPSLRIADAAVAEPAFPGVRMVSLPVSLSAASSQEVRVQWRTVNGSAVGGASSLCHLHCGDFVNAAGVLVFPPLTTSRTISLVINGDRLVEKPERFTVLLESPTGATIDDGTGVVTIGQPAAALSSLPLEATALTQGKATPLALRWGADSTPDGLALRLAGAPADAPFLRWSRDEGTLASCRASVVPRGSAALPVLDCAPALRLGSQAGLSLGQGLRVQLAASRFSSLLDSEARAAGLQTELTLTLSEIATAAGGSVMIEVARLGADGQLGAFSPLMPLDRPAAGTGSAR